MGRTVRLLEDVAREDLRSGDVTRVQRAITLLTKLGTADDVAALRRVATSDSPLAEDARRAMAAIENREARGEKPQLEEVPTLLRYAWRVVVGMVGVASGAVAVSILLDSLATGHWAGHLTKIIGGFVVALSLLTFAWSGDLPGSRR